MVVREVRKCEDIYMLALRTAQYQIFDRKVVVRQQQQQHL